MQCNEYVLILFIEWLNDSDNDDDDDDVVTEGLYLSSMWCGVVWHNI